MPKAKPLDYKVLPKQVYVRWDENEEFLVVGLALDELAEPNEEFLIGRYSLIGRAELMEAKLAVTLKQKR